MSARAAIPVLTATLPLVLVLSACSSAGAGAADTDGPGHDTQHYDAMSHEELVAAAEEEGEVVVYSFTSRIATVAEEFRQEYPGITITEHDISSSEQIERLASEHAAGAPTADVAYVSDAPVVVTQLIEEGVLLPYVPPRMDDLLPEEHKEPLVTNRLSTKVLMYNEEAHPDGAPVENLWELTAGEWEGRVVMVDPNGRGDYLDMVTEMVLRADEMDAAYQEWAGEPLQQHGGMLRSAWLDGAVLASGLEAAEGTVLTAMYRPERLVLAAAEGEQAPERGAEVTVLEATPSAGRFVVTVAAGAAGRFSVVEEQRIAVGARRRLVLPPVPDALFDAAGDRWEPAG